MIYYQSLEKLIEDNNWSRDKVEKALKNRITWTSNSCSLNVKLAKIEFNKELHVADLTGNCVMLENNLLIDSVIVNNELFDSLYSYYEELSFPYVKISFSIVEKHLHITSVTALFKVADYQVGWQKIANKWMRKTPNQGEEDLVKSINSWQQKYPYLQLFNATNKEMLVKVNGQEVILKPNNFPIYNTKWQNVDIQYLDEAIEQKFTKELFITEDNLDLFARYGVKYEAKYDLYSSVYELENADKLVVLFPALGAGKYRYPVNYLKNLQGVHKLLFADVTGSRGSYLAYDNDGNDFTNNVVNKIRDTMKKLKIAEKNVYFMGVSKGASTAINYGKFFKDVTIFAGVPQLNPSEFTKTCTPDQIFLKNGYDIYDIELKTNNIYYAVSEYEKESHCFVNLVDINKSVNVTYLPNEYHMLGGFSTFDKFVGTLTFPVRKIHLAIEKIVLSVEKEQSNLVIPPHISVVDIIFIEVLFPANEEYQETSVQLVIEQRKIKLRPAKEAIVYFDFNYLKTRTGYLKIYTGDLVYESQILPVEFK